MAAVNITSNLYNLTEIGTANDIYEFTKLVNNMTDQWFMLGILLVGWVILYISMKDYGNDQALMTASFITTVLTIFFATLDFIAPYIALIIGVPFALLFVRHMLKGT